MNTKKSVLRNAQKLERNELKTIRGGNLGLTCEPGSRECCDPDLDICFCLKNEIACEL